RWANPWKTESRVTRNARYMPLRLEARAWLPPGPDIVSIIRAPMRRPVRPAGVSGVPMATRSVVVLERTNISVGTFVPGIVRSVDVNKVPAFCNEASLPNIADAAIIMPADVMRPLTLMRRSESAEYVMTKRDAMLRTAEL